jgi:hypothetical protein
MIGKRGKGWVTGKGLERVQVIVIPYLASIGIVKTLNQLYDGTFATPTCPYQRHCPTRQDLQV